MFIIYDLLFLLFSLIYLPYMLLKRKFHQGFSQRLGFGLSKITGKSIWFHAVSVGEVMAITPLVKSIRQEYPDFHIVISTTTFTGQKIACQLAGTIKNAQAIYSPLDVSFIVRKFIRQLNPIFFILAETEFWPNLINELHHRQVKIALVNGRVSDNSFRGYYAARGLFRGLFQKVSLFMVQGGTDAERLRAIGAEAGKIHPVGSLKFDNIAAIEKTSYAESGLLVAGSTHPGEEEIILKAYKLLLKDFPKLSLLIAPRHPERGTEVARLAQSLGFSPKLRSAGDIIPAVGTVLILDVIGELQEWYAKAQVIFVGGSITVKGGHNIIEPAIMSKPIVIGPHMENFQEICDIFIRAQALIQIKSSTELYPALNNLLSDQQAGRNLGEAAHQVVLAHQGATLKTVNHLSFLLAL